MEILNKLQKKNDFTYKSLKNIYGNTIGLWWFKEWFIRHIGFSNGEKRLKLLSNTEGDEIIVNKIKSRKPFMLGRFGSSEVRGIFKNDFYMLCFNAGFFPKDKKLLGRFKKVYLDAARYLDILCVWNYRNHFINKIKLMRTLSNVENLVSFSAMGGINHLWLKELRGKKILVIHPFKKTIESQYKKRARIGILPKLENLQVIKAVQTLGDSEDGRFETWFDALDFMKKEIDKKDFDIALIACGAYGLPLAAHVKSIGKQALHIGGSLQLLFGIKGKRWNDVGIYDENWVSPMKEDFLKDYKKFEGGCYW